MSIKLTYEILCVGKTVGTNTFPIAKRLCCREGWIYERQAQTLVIHASKIFKDKKKAIAGKNRFVNKFRIAKTRLMGIRPCMIKEL